MRVPRSRTHFENDPRNGHNDKRARADRGKWKCTCTRENVHSRTHTHTRLRQPTANKISRRCCCCLVYTIQRTRCAARGELNKERIDSRRVGMRTHSRYCVCVVQLINGALCAAQQKCALAPRRFGLVHLLADDVQPERSRQVTGIAFRQGRRVYVPGAHVCESARARAVYARISGVCVCVCALS